MTLFETMSAIGMVAGAAALVLGLAQVACEHARSAWPQRVTTLLLSLVAGWTSLDAWDAWSGVDPTLDAKAVAFCIALAMSWGYRRAFGLKTTARPPVKADTL